MLWFEVGRHECTSSLVECVAFKFSPTIFQYMKMLLNDMLHSLSIREVSSLYPHEQTLAANLKRLKEAMLNIGQLVDPIIIDKETGVVLDGNHRLKVLQMIECPLTACQLVNYNDSKIQVGTWFPATKEPLEKIIKNNKIKVERIDCEKGKRELKSLDAPFMAVRNIRAGAPVCDAFLLDPGKYKIREMTEEQHYILSCLNGVEWEYISDDVAEEYLSKGYTVLFRRPFTKEEILRAAKEHNPFPPKSTRHLIPDRVVRLNMRLGWLHEGREEATRHLNNMLSRRAYEGNVRRYNEPVIVIY